MTVTGVDDFVDDGNVAYSIVTGAATSGDPNYDGLNPSDVSVSPPGSAPEARWKLEYVTPPPADDSARL